MRALRCTGPVVLAVPLILLFVGRLSVGEAAVVFVAVEVVLAVAAVAQGAAAVRSYRAARGGGADRETAFEAAARAVLPGPIAIPYGRTAGRSASRS